MLRVRPIHFTSDPESFLPIFETLGLVRLPGQDDARDWIEFDAGSGRLALHRVDRNDPLDGVTKLGFEVRDLAEFVRRTEAELPKGASIRTGSENFGEFAVVTAADDVELQAEATGNPEQTPGADPKLRVNQMWYTTDIPAGSSTLQAMGAMLRVESNSGDYAELTAKNGGNVMVHIGSLATPGGLGFGYAGNTEPVLEKLKAAGVRAYLVDETYGRTLHVDNPDEPRLSNTPTGPTIWIDEDAGKDNYGYTVHD